MDLNYCFRDIENNYNIIIFINTTKYNFIIYVTYFHQIMNIIIKYQNQLKNYYYYKKDIII